jgi:tripartite-type tricarboxylate transporter receptor subunit TctC
MDRLVLVAFGALAFASPAFGQCQLCAPGSGAPAVARAIPLSISVEAALDLGRAAQTRPGGGGTISLDAQTGARRVTGSLADLGGFALKGMVRLSGEPFAPVSVSVPSRISLTSPDGSTADVVEIQTDLPAGATLDAQGKLSFRFGGRLIVTAGQAGDFRGRIPIVADYR